jgi:hypothetical protein
MEMRLIVDGKEVKFQNDVKVIWEDEPDIRQEFCLTATNEGIILDRFIIDYPETRDRGETCFECDATAALEISDLDAFCH